MSEICAPGEFLQIDTAESKTLLGCKNDLNIHTTVPRKGLPIPVPHKVFANWCLAKHQSLQVPEMPQSTVFVKFSRQVQRHIWIKSMVNYLCPHNTDEVVHTICELGQERPLIRILKGTL